MLSCEGLTSSTYSFPACIQGGVYTYIYIFILFVSNRVMSWTGPWIGSSPTWTTWSPWMSPRAAALPPRARAAETLRPGPASETDQAVSPRRNPPNHLGPLAAETSKRDESLFFLSLHTDSTFIHSSHPPIISAALYSVVCEGLMVSITESNEYTWDRCPVHHRAQFHSHT